MSFAVRWLAVTWAGMAGFAQGCFAQQDAPQQDVAQQIGQISSPGRAEALGAKLLQQSRAAGAAAVDGARAGLGFAGLALQALWNIVATVSAIAWHKLDL